MEERKCLRCGKVIIQTSTRGKKYCDNKCRTRYISLKLYYKNKNNPKKIEKRQKYQRRYIAQNREKHNIYMRNYMFEYNKKIAERKKNEQKKVEEIKEE